MKTRKLLLMQLMLRAWLRLAIRFVSTKLSTRVDMVRCDRLSVLTAGAGD